MRHILTPVLALMRMFRSNLSASPLRQDGKHAALYDSVIRASWLASGLEMSWMRTPLDHVVHWHVRWVIPAAVELAMGGPNGLSQKVCHANLVGARYIHP